MYKNSLYTIFSLQTHSYPLYIFLFKTILLKMDVSSNSIFILGFDLSRSTGWVDRPVSGQAGRPAESTVVLADARIRVHVARSTGRVDRNLPV